MDYKDWDINKYFYPEIRKYNVNYLNDLIIENANFKNFVEENDLDLEFFHELRRHGGKEPAIIKMIQDDNINEFVSFIEHSEIDLEDIIRNIDSVFDKYVNYLTPLEYSALFGSIAIFKYLHMKDVNITVRNGIYYIIRYAVQGRNYEIIHLLEERKEIKEELNNRKNQLKYLEEPIKMHYNEIFEYFVTNYQIKITMEIIDLIIGYRNYQLLDHLIDSNQIEFNNKATVFNIFYSICKNANEEIVKILINHPNLIINSKNKIFDYFLRIVEMNKKMIWESRVYSWFLIKIEIGRNIVL